MSQEEQFDGYFREVLHRGKGIDNLFTSLFSFLRRQSDFFEQPDPGFKALTNSFNAQKDIFIEKKKKEQEKKEKKEKLEREKLEKEKLKDTKTESGSGVKEISKEEFEKLKNKGESSTSSESKKEDKKEEVETKNSKKEEPKEEEDTQEKERKEKCTKMDEDVRKELLKRTEGYEDKNGGRSRYYTWTQPQIEQFEMFVPLGKDVKSSDVKVEYDSKHLKVKLKGEYIVNGELFAPINADSFYWTIDENKKEKYISITFDKIYKMVWWDCVVKGDDILTLSKINPEASKLSDLDPSMRPEVEKMMIENNYKLNNKPYHKDPKTNDMLQKFMKEHPEMDFSKAKIS